MSFVRVVGQTSPSFHINDVGITVNYGEEVSISNTVAQTSKDLWVAIRLKKIIQIPVLNSVKSRPNISPQPAVTTTGAISATKQDATPESRKQGVELLVVELQEQNRVLKEILKSSQESVNLLTSMVEKIVRVGGSFHHHVPSSITLTSSPLPQEEGEDTPTVYVPSFSTVEPSPEFQVKEESSSSSTVSATVQRLKERRGTRADTPGDKELS